MFYYRCIFTCGWPDCPDSQYFLESFIKTMAILVPSSFISTIKKNFFKVESNSMWLRMKFKPSWAVPSKEQTCVSADFMTCVYLWMPCPSVPLAGTRLPAAEASPWFPSWARNSSGSQSSDNTVDVCYWSSSGLFWPRGEKQTQSAAFHKSETTNKWKPEMWVYCVSLHSQGTDELGFALGQIPHTALLHLRAVHSGVQRLFYYARSRSGF